MYTLGNYLTSVLVGVHTINNLDRGDEQENEGYESLVVHTEIYSRGSGRVQQESAQKTIPIRICP